MSRSIITRRRRTGWRMAAMGVAVATLVVISQGCCSWARKNCWFPTTHSMTFAVDLGECPCPAANCVCPVPMLIEHANRGDKIQFVNATLYKVTVKPAAGINAFVEGDVVTLDPDEIKVVTLSDSLEGGFSLEVTVDPPGEYCPGYPGPGVDVDD